MNLISLTTAIRRASAILANAAPRLQSPLLLVIRLYFGWQFFLTGKGKLMNLNQTAEFFAGLHIPLPWLNALVAGTTECVGGLLLLVGLASRVTALPLIFTMCIAYLTADSEAVKSLFSDPEKFLSATPFLFLFASLLVLVFGPGSISLDWIIARFHSAPIQPQSASPNAAPLFARPASQAIAK